jgi:hypothetical protein
MVSLAGGCRPFNGTDIDGRNSKELPLALVDQFPKTAFKSAVKFWIADNWVILTQDPADIRLAYARRLRNGGRAESKHPANRPQPANIGVVLDGFPVKATGMRWNAVSDALWGIC